MVTKSGTTDRKCFSSMTGETLQVGSTMLGEVSPGVAADFISRSSPPPEPGGYEVEV